MPDKSIEQTCLFFTNKYYEKIAIIGFLAKFLHANVIEKTKTEWPQK
jgi:hypothetical protein